MQSPKTSMSFSCKEDTFVEVLTLMTRAHSWNCSSVMIS